MKRLTLNKKGEELVSSETIKFFIAIIGIFLLIFLAIKLGGIFFKNSEYETAKVQLEEIYSLSENLKEGDVKTYLIEGPRDWSFFLDSQNEKNLCMCKTKNCDEKDKICKLFSKEILLNKAYKDFACIKTLLDQAPSTPIFQTKPSPPYDFCKIDEKITSNGNLYYSSSGINEAAVSLERLPISIFLEIVDSKVYISFEATRQTWEIQKSMYDSQLVNSLNMHTSLG